MLKFVSYYKAGSNFWGFIWICVWNWVSLKNDVYWEKNEINNERFWEVCK